MNQGTRNRRNRRLIAVIPGAAAIAFGLLAFQPVLASGQAAGRTPSRTAAASLNPSRSASPRSLALTLPLAVDYTDCTGTTQLGRTAIYRDWCLPGVYLVAHNPGPFTSILGLKTGSQVSYGGRNYRVSSVDLMTTTAQWAEAHSHPAELTLQTCANDGLGRVWVFKATRA